MIQTIRSILHDPDDRTQMKLLFANKTPDDTILKDVLDQLAEAHKDRFAVWYTVSNVDPAKKDEWKYSVGHIDERMIRDRVFAPCDDVVAFVCGPPAMVEAACAENLRRFGYNDESIYEF
jgi:NAD(P)H-flavin reductase